MADRCLFRWQCSALPRTYEGAPRSQKTTYNMIILLNVVVDEFGDILYAGRERERQESASGLRPTNRRVVTTRPPILGGRRWEIRGQYTYLYLS